MEIIELEKAIEVAREYLYRASDGEELSEIDAEMANKMRDNSYEAEGEEEFWQYDEATEEQIKLIRYMIYHNYENLTKGDACRIIRILKQTRED